MTAQRSILQREMDLKWVISEEERTRHDALFYSQKPQDRYLSGEQARSLFIRSKLPLPELSKIWKLADVSRNNMLDTSEFAVAMHLIQSRLKGTDIPEKLPGTLAPAKLPQVNIPVMSEEEKQAYEKAFKWKTDVKTGHIDAATACSILIKSGLPEDVLARIWNLSDIDRDGKLSVGEFLIALHVARFCQQGNSIEGTVNVRSILSEQMTEESYDTKKLRLAEVQTEKRKLLSVKEKLCHEIAGGLDDESVAKKVQEELDQVERQILVLEKEENELRRTLQQLKDKSKRESFKPFDRSFLLKRHPTGEDIFRGSSKNNRAALSDEKDLEIQKLWKEDVDLSAFGASISEEPSTPDVFENIRQDQFGRTVIDLSQTQESASLPSSSSTTRPVLNGIGNEKERSIAHLVYTGDNKDDILEKHQTELVNKERGFHLSSDKDVDKKLFDRVDSNNKNYHLMNGSSPSNSPEPETNKTLNSESTQYNEVKRPTKRILHEKTMYENNRTDDEKSSSLQMAAKIDANANHSTSVVRDKLAHRTDEDKTEVAAEGSSNSADSAVEELVEVTMATTSQSSRMDDLTINLGEDEESFGHRINSPGEAQAPSSPRSMTQDELLPYILEEKKRKEEERAKQRELDEEMRRKAREDSQKLNEEAIRNAEQRKEMFEEERRKLEHQTSLAQEGQEKRKAPLSRSEAGRIIEQELEEQIIREQLTRIEMEKIKEKERIELEKQKLKRAKKEEHPAAFQKDLIQTPVIDEKGDTVDGGDFRGVRLSNKRGSVIDLIDSDGNVEQTERPVENRPAPEHVNKPPQPQKQLPSQPQVQPHYQPVIRRAKEGGKSAANRNLENRKSIVELEIERQKEREEEARREAELARRAQAKQQGGGQSIENKTEENKPKEHHPKKDVAMRPPSVHKRTEKFEKKSGEFKAKEHRPKQAVERNDVAGKNPGLQTQVEIEPAVEEKKEMVVASSPPMDGVDGMQSIENGGESQGKEFETEEERKRREEKEYFRQMQEEEKRRREAQKQDLERIRKEVDRKEAEELMRSKLEKEEEKKKQREVERRLAEERQKDKTENQKKVQEDAATRKTAFAAHKVILEQRVLKALEESKQENTLSKRRASSFDRATDFPEQDDTVSEENVEELSSGGVKLRKANFEKSGARKDSKEELRKKRFSLNLDNARRGLNQSEHAPLQSVHLGSLKGRAPYAADDVFVKESQAQENAVTRRSASSNGSNLSKAKSFGDLSLKKGGRNDDLSAHPVLRKVSLSNDQTDSVDGLPTFSDSKIQQELEEQRIREGIVKQEALEREKRHRMEEEKRKAVEQPTSKKEMSLSDIKRNPLPNKIQVKKPQQSSNRDSLTHSMAAHWETVLHSVPDGGEEGKSDRRKSVIELEKEEERRRTQELQKERERVSLERKKKEQDNLFLKQKKLEQENERKRKEKEEKEKRQQRTTAMKSLFEKMGGNK